MSGENEQQEIIIVRRGGDGEDGHHGGAWKIAFADFMTAMMALFLVLWLINAANEETKKSVASYFNPVKLVDRNRSKKGLFPPSEVVNPGEFESSEESSPQQGSPVETDGEEITDQAFFASPQDALEKIVSEAESDGAAEGFVVVEVAETSESETAQDEYLDPFSPGYWELVPAPEVTPAADETPVADEAETDEEAPATELAQAGDETPATEMAQAESEAQAESDTPAMDAAQAGSEAAEQAIEPDRELLTAALETEAGDEDQPEPEMETAQEQDQPAEPVEAEDQNPEMAGLATRIEEELADALRAIGLKEGQLSIDLEENSVLISVTDDIEMSMFDIGSAVPKARAVNLVAAIGATLASEQVNVHISGHTDSRPFAGGTYDNWQLSAARAQAARYMLERGGLADSQVRSVSGKADRQPKNADDGFADENRRIEILVELAR